MSRSDGASADYYVLPEGATQLQDLISHRDMNSQIGEIFRACYRYGIVSHSDKMRDAKKIRFYAQAEVERLENLVAASEQCGQVEAQESALSNWKLWKKGDIVEALESAGSIKKGDSYMLQRDSDESGDVHFFDDDGDLRNRSCIDYQFVCRPASIAK